MGEKGSAGRLSSPDTGARRRCLDGGPLPSWKGRSGVAMAARRAQAASWLQLTSRAASAASQFRPMRPCSSDRRPFCNDSGKVRPMAAIASPTDCIRVPRTSGVPRELLEGPPWDLGDDVVDGRLEAGRGLAGDVVGDLVERVSPPRRRRDLGDRVSGRFSGKRGGTGHTRVHFDHETMSPLSGWTPN